VQTHPPAAHVVGGMPCGNVRRPLRKILIVLTYVLLRFIIIIPPSNVAHSYISKEKKNSYYTPEFCCTLTPSTVFKKYSADYNRPSNVIQEFSLYKPTVPSSTTTGRCSPHTSSLRSVTSSPRLQYYGLT